MDLFDRIISFISFMGGASWLKNKKTEIWVTYLAKKLGLLGLTYIYIEEYGALILADKQETITVMYQIGQELPFFCFEARLQLGKVPYYVFEYDSEKVVSLDQGLWEKVIELFRAYLVGRMIGGEK